MKLLKNKAVQAVLALALALGFTFTASVPAQAVTRSVSVSCQYKDYYEHAAFRIDQASYSYASVNMYTNPGGAFIRSFGGYGDFTYAASGYKYVTFKATSPTLYGVWAWCQGGSIPG